MKIPYPPINDELSVYLVEPFYYKWKYGTLRMREIRNIFTPVEKVLLFSRHRMRIKLIIVQTSHPCTKY